MVDKSSLLRQAAMLLRISKNTLDQNLAATLVQRAADLQGKAEAMDDDLPASDRAFGGK